MLSFGCPDLLIHITMCVHARGSPGLWLTPPAWTYLFRAGVSACCSIGRLCLPLPVFIPLLLLKLVLDHGTIIAPRRCPLDLPSIPLWVISTPVSVSFKTYRWPRFSRSIFWFAHAEHWNLYYISHTRWTQSTLRSSLTWDFLHVRIKFIENYWPCVLE